MAETTTKPKRGRGRPRKNAPKAKESDKQAAETSSEIENEEIKQTENIEPMAGKEEPETETTDTSGFDVQEAEVINDEYSPLNDEVIQRGYEHGNEELAAEGQEIDIPQADLTFDSQEDVEGDIPSQPNHEAPKMDGGGNSSFAQSSPTKAPASEEKGYWESNHSTTAETTTETPKEKRKNAAKMADTLIMVYKENVPLLFKAVAKFNEGKISRMELNGEIDRNMPIMRDGTTVGMYVSQVNAQIDKNFVITDEQAKEIREPLIDWLMEKDLKLTPSQRLAIAVGGQMVSFGLAAIQQWQQNRHAMNQFAEFHAEWRQQGGGQPQAAPQPQPETQYAEEIPPQHQEAPVQEQASTPMDNLSDHEMSDNENLIRDDATTYTVETVKEEGEIDMDSYMMGEEAPKEEVLEEDIPT
jgi:hypothetical protein